MGTTSQRAVLDSTVCHEEGKDLDLNGVLGMFIVNVEMFSIREQRKV